MSMGASAAGLSLSMMSTAGLSMPLATGLSLSMSSLAVDSDASSADTTSSNDGDISDLVSSVSDSGTEPVDQVIEEEPTSVTPGTNSSTVTSPTGDVAQTTDTTSSLPNGSEKKSSKATAAVVGALSVAGVALLAGVVVRKKMAHGNSDASVADNSLPNSVL